MSREILFRGKRLDNGEWIEGDGIHYPKSINYLGSCWIDGMGECANDWVQVDPATVGQFTGLCDKNGVKIFEGDILTTDLIRPYVIVVFRDGSFMFNYNDGDKDYYDIMLPIMKNAQTQTLYHKVIGNIHDNNPEYAMEELK